MSRADKVAFIHFAKVAGRHIGYHLCTQVFANRTADPAEQEYKTFNSWERPFLLGRDWTETELLQIANNRFPAQRATPGQIRRHHRRWAHNYLDRQYVHNHHYSWNKKTVREFRRKGWLTFMFIRDPADLLCSLWTWARKALAAGEDPLLILQPVSLLQLELDPFIREILTQEELQRIFALPDYVDDIEYVAEFSGENFRLFLDKYFALASPTEAAGEEQRYASGNPGYAAYRREGKISDETHALLDANPQVQRVRDCLGTR